MESLGHRRSMILMNQYKAWVKSPDQYFIAIPEETNLAKWTILICNLGEPFEYGEYIVQFEAGSDFPKSAPKNFQILTPNGVFEPGGPICLSMGEFHDKEKNRTDSWRPSMGMKGFAINIANALINFKDLQHGIRIIHKPEPEDIQTKARESRRYNKLKNSELMKKFEEYVVQNQAMLPVNSLLETRKRSEAKSRPGRSIVVICPPSPADDPRFQKFPGHSQKPAQPAVLTVEDERVVDAETKVKFARPDSHPTDPTPQNGAAPTVHIAAGGKAKEVPKVAVTLGVPNHPVRRTKEKSKPNTRNGIEILQGILQPQTPTVAKKDDQAKDEVADEMEATEPVADEAKAAPVVSKSGPALAAQPKKAESVTGPAVVAHPKDPKAESAPVVLKKVEPAPAASKAEPVPKKVESAPVAHLKDLKKAKPVAAKRKQPPAANPKDPKKIESMPVANPKDPTVAAPAPTSKKIESRPVPAPKKIAPAASKTKAVTRREEIDDIGSSPLVYGAPLALEDVYAEDEVRPRRESQIVQPAVQKIEAKEDAAKRDELQQQGARAKGQKPPPTLQIKTLKPKIPSLTFTEGPANSARPNRDPVKSEDVKSEDVKSEDVKREDVRIEQPESLPDNIQESETDSGTDALIDELLRGQE